METPGSFIIHGEILRSSIPLETFPLIMSVSFSVLFNREAVFLDRDNVTKVPEKNLYKIRKNKIIMQGGAVDFQSMREYI